MNSAALLAALCLLFVSAATGTESDTDNSTSFSEGRAFTNPSTANFKYLCNIAESATPTLIMDQCLGYNDNYVVTTDENMPGTADGTTTYTSLLITFPFITGVSKIRKSLKLVKDNTTSGVTRINICLIKVICPLSSSTTYKLPTASISLTDPSVNTVVNINAIQGTTVIAATRTVFSDSQCNSVQRFVAGPIYVCLKDIVDLFDGTVGVGTGQWGGPVTSVDGLTVYGLLVFGKPNLHAEYMIHLGNTAVSNFMIANAV